MKYKLVRSLFCLNPQKMIELPGECMKAFEIVMSKLIEAKWRSSSVADDLLKQYKCFLQVIKKEHDLELKNCKKELMSFCMHASMTRRSFRFFGVHLNFADSLSQPVSGRKRIKH